MRTPQAISVFAVIFLTCLSLYRVQGEHHCEGLILTPYIKNGSTIEARELSIVDRHSFLDLHSHSGFITVDKKYNSNLFFWYFPHDDVTTAPWIIWLNGGPGDSSMIGLFDQIGPIKIENGIMKKRNTTWATDYSLLFVDSPVGAGFSFTKNESGYTNSVHEVSEHLYEFLQQFLEVFPEQAEAPLFIAGEAYAGKYVPAFAMHIHSNNHNQTHRIKLKGISLGNPLIDPRNMLHYSELTRELGLLQDEQFDELCALENVTANLIDQGEMVDAAKKFNETIEYIKKKTGVSIYNFLKDPLEVRPAFEDYLKRPDVRRRIHAGNANFDLHNHLVYEKMLPDIVNSTKMMLEELLASYGVMCYHGQLDLLMPYGLSKRVYNQLQWKGREEFLRAPRKRLRHYPDDKVVAFKKAGGNFVEIMIRGCGHMVPKEEPDLAKFVIDMFIEMFKNIP